MGHLTLKCIKSLGRSGGQFGHRGDFWVLALWPRQCRAALDELSLEEHGIDGPRRCSDPCHGKEPSWAAVKTSMIYPAHCQVAHVWRGLGVWRDRPVSWCFLDFLGSQKTSAS